MPGVRVKCLGPLFASVMVLAVTQVGCAPKSVRSQLAAVAKDWSRLLRASQMIPVYPLTEDLRPGDIFLVETPIQEQAAEYERGGFLRLEQHLGRLSALKYSEFYGSSFGVPTTGWPPDHWNSKHASAPGTSASSEDRWAEAPAAAYPTYNFSVRAGRSASLALPVKAVPLGVSYLDAKRVQGSITIADANTYGLSLDQLRGEFEHWFYDDARVRNQVARIRGAVGSTVYLRLISRVFLAKRVVVTLQSEESKGGSASAGSDQTPDLPETGAPAESGYAAGRTVLNQALAGAAPGGGIKLLQASDRAVSMSETFTRPLVVGYLSFDFPVLADGSLGPPAATLARLERAAPALPTLGASTQTARQLEAWQLYVASRPEAQRARVYAYAAEAMRPEFKRKLAEQPIGGSAEAFRSAVRGYLIGKSPIEQHQQELIAALERALERLGED